MRPAFSRTYGKLWKEWTWLTESDTKRSREQIRRLKNSFKGNVERCFIIGNGPSLRNMDLQPLKHEVTFGQNRIYLLFDKMGFETTFLVAVNYLVLRQFSEDFDGLSMPKFVQWESRNEFQNKENLLYVRFKLGPSIDNPSTLGTLPFSRNIPHRVWLGSTVTYVSMQIAYYLGFKQVILIGVDHNFTSKGEEGKVVISQGDDPNHFAPNYFGQGVQWQLPGLESSEVAYRIAKQFYEKNDREILDATIGGKLNVFPKVEYTGLF